MPKYSVVLFDMDGTIADTDEVILRSMYELYDLYRDGKRTPDEQIYYFSGPPITETLKKEFPHQDQKMMIQEFVRVSKIYYHKCLHEYPNCRETLLELKKAGIKLGVVTNKATPYAIKCLELVRLDDVFDYLIGYDDVVKKKPDGEGILKSAKHFNVKDLKNILYVGDNVIDLDTANNAGVDCCLVCWGPRVLPKDINPKYKIYKHEELKGVVLDEKCL